MSNHNPRAPRPPLPVHLRNPRRAYDVDGHEIAPMTLQQAIDKGVTALRVTCDCGHVNELSIYAGRWPSTSFVPDVGMTLRCSACSTSDLWTEPAWPVPKSHAALDRAASAQTDAFGSDPSSFGRGTTSRTLSKPAKRRPPASR
ncbi:hypothetical protein [Methylobacterium sp. 275MFSha3.1]|uniref:hypothetical protein n=1 Tax=Methylobacterium sp. 275MFSha3.1 TaxID=1502746 RepID=UPI00111525C3|nr:hypothetical protein [Methylobacterium sp. 275MFSha3.1]